MHELKDSKVLRGGATEDYVKLETTICHYSVDVRLNAMSFQFELTAAGGGTTSVVLRIARDDLPELLSKLANSFPELAPSFATTTAIGYKQNMCELEEARRKLQVLSSTL